jgi:hypothetical protein
MVNQLYKIYWHLLGALALIFVPTIAHADDLVVDFALSPQVEQVVLPQTTAPVTLKSANPDSPLVIPPTAANAPIQELADHKTPLPPPPPLLPTSLLSTSVGQPEDIAPEDIAPIAEAFPPDPEMATVHPPVSEQGAEEGTSSILPWLSFELSPPRYVEEREPSEQGAIAQGGEADYTLDSLFAGGADSLVARIVGSAEGTRATDGGRNPAYYGHTDPGNGVWNLGSFSYQHGAATPEAADERQLQRLRQQAQSLQARAQQFGLSLSLEEKLNAIDLANQAPQAALDRGGYIDWLAEARTLKLDGEEGIVWARTRSFLDPDTQQWNAPGLGNTVQGISHDQERRMRAIARALSAYQQQYPLAVVGAIAQGSPPSEPPEISDEPHSLERLFELNLDHESAISSAF